MLATCRKSFEIIFHALTCISFPNKNFMHVRENSWELINVNFTCWLHVENVSELIMYLFSSTMVVGLKSLGLLGAFREFLPKQQGKEDLG